MYEKILCVVGLVCLTGCFSSVIQDVDVVSKKDVHTYADTIDEQDIAYVKVDADMAYNMADPIQLKNHATNVFLASVSSIDYATCNLEGYTYSPIPYTVGKLEILNNYVGEAEGIVKFSKSGGTVTLEEYNRNAPQESVSKKEYLQKESNTEVKYMNVKFTNDIALETNKTYLIYATYNEEYDRYEIIGFAYGSREVQGVHSKTRTVSDEATIVNNETGQTESFKEYVDTYLGA